MAGKTSANPNEFILPDLGEGVHEAELIKWRVKVGDAVNEHDILAEMETDKALVEVPSPRTGVIASLHGNEGEILHVGNVLVSYVGDGGTSKPAPAITKPSVRNTFNTAKKNKPDGTASTRASSVSGPPPHISCEGVLIPVTSSRRTTARP